MARHRWNVVLVALLLVSAGLNWYVRQPARVPNVEFAPNMARGPGFSAYEANPNFTDGLTTRAPEPGTIARGMPPFAFGPGAAEAQRAGVELANPFSSSDAAAVARGAAVYAHYCQVCHGADGKGSGPVTEHGFRRPPTLLRAFTKGMKDGQIFHLVTYGRGGMPSHAAQVPVNDRWKAILHVRQLQRGAGSAPVAGAAEAGGE